MNAPEDPSPTQPTRRDGAPQLKHLQRFALLILLLGAILASWGISSRLKQRSTLQRTAEDGAVPVVSIMHARKSGQTESVVLPANIQAFADAAIYARTNGYLRRWYVDIGTAVKAGTLLAEIETPEIDAQLRQAQADLATSEANSTLASSTAERWRRLLSTGTVAKQDVDEKEGDAAAKRAAMESARANVRRLEELEGFKRVVAPFDGIITARHTDNGALITSGTGTGTGQELFHLAAAGKLRIYVQVPQTYASAVRVGTKGELRLADTSGAYQAVVTSTAQALDSRTRTLLIQLSVTNPAGLLPGSYGEVSLQVPGSGGALRLPANTLVNRSEGPSVAVVDEHGVVRIRSVRLGRDLGTEVEILDGVGEADNIVLNPTDSLISGAHVRIAAPQG